MKLFIILSVFISFICMPQVYASPENMIEEGSYKIEYLQIIHNRGSSYQDNRDNTLIWSNSICGRIKFEDNPNFFYLDLGKIFGNLDAPLAQEQKDNILSYLLQQIGIGTQVQVGKSLMWQNWSGAETDYWFFIEGTPFGLDEPLYAGWVRGGYKCEILGTFN